MDTLVIQVDKLCTPPVFTGLGNVKWLKLVDTLLSPRFLTGILDACPQLESFILSYSVRESFRSIFDHATTPKTLPQVLSVRQETLRYLEIYGMPGPIDDSGIEIVGSLKGLTNLETLILVGSGFRFGKSEDKKTVETCLADLLPPSIRSVSIDSDYMSIIHGPIIALGEAVKQGSFPMLKEVRCYHWLYEHLEASVLEKISGSSITPEELEDFWESSSCRPLSRLSRTCNVSFSGTNKRLFERDAGRLERS